MYVQGTAATVYQGGYEGVHDEMRIYVAPHVHARDKHILATSKCVTKLTMRYVHTALSNLQTTF